MMLRLLVMHRKETYPGEYAPEVLAVVDEWTMDENPDWWPLEVAKQQDAIGDDAAAWAEVEAHVDQDALMKALYPTSTVTLTLEP